MNKNELRDFVIKIDDYKVFRIIHNILYHENEDMELLLTNLSRSHFLEFPLYLKHDSKRWIYIPDNEDDIKEFVGFIEPDYITSKDFIRIMKLSKIIEN